MSVLTKNNYIKANALMSYTDIASADVEVLQQTATDMGYDEFAQATNGDLLMKKTEVVGSYTYVTTFNCRTEDVSVTVTASPKIVFADSDVKAIVANAYGSDGEITEEQAAAVTTWFSGNDTSSNPFFRNRNVDSFDEFGTYFTSVTSIGTAAFFQCSKLTSLTIPASVTEIGNGAFRYCSGLTSVTIPDSVTSIGEFAFNGCSRLTSVTIPDSVTSIGLYAFYTCTGLTSITCEATTPPTLGSIAFAETANCPIYVPSASLDAYKSAWSDYASRIQAIAEPETQNENEN